MKRPIQAAQRIVSPLMAALLVALALPACSSRTRAKDPLPALFDEGRDIFYGTVADEVERNPRHDRLTAAERAKIGQLKTVYPRLYGLMINYGYAQDAPAFAALLEEGSPESMARFRERYLTLVGKVARLFSDGLFIPSPTGFYFKDLIPRFKGKDIIDIAVMSTGNMANIDLPDPKKVVPKTLSPEFDKQWGLDAARFREAHKLTRGGGVRVAVMDSGVDATHPIFKNTHWGHHFNFVGRDGFPWSEAGPPMVDWGWHGTVVSSIVARYAPEVQITLYRYLDADSQNDSPIPTIVSANMADAIYKAVHDGNDVINISAGTNLDVMDLREACRYAWDRNVIIVTGSPYYLGRYLGGADDFPAQYPTTIAVTGIDRLGENKYGYWTAAAPDPMTDVGSPDAPFVAYPSYCDEKDDYAPGISCATPIVASLAALAVSVYPKTGTEPPGEYVETIRKLIRENANSKMVGFDGFSPDCGFGMIDAVKTVEAAMRLGAARPVIASIPLAPARSSASEDAVFAEGRTVFHRELKLRLGLHSQRDRLLASEVAKINAKAEGLAGLYENLMNTAFWNKAPELPSLRSNDPSAFRSRWLLLCREMADRFIESLFVESPATQEMLRAPQNRGRGRLDLVLASLGMGPASTGLVLDGLEGADRSLLDTSRALRLARFAGARQPDAGRGVRIAIIDSGCDFTLAALKNAKFNHALDLSLTGGTRPPWSGERVPPDDADGRGSLMAALAAWCAPGAEIRIYKISDHSGQPYEYWPAYELAQALYKAVDDGCDIVITGAAFGHDFDFLAEACRDAYLRNVTIFAPNGLIGSATPGATEEIPCFPATYNTVIAVAGAGGTGAGLKPWTSSAPSKSTAVTGPAFIGRNLPPSNAYAAAVAGGLAALVMPGLPRTDKELPGQYVQRIAEVLKKSADAEILGFGTFNAKIGYGFIDATKTLGAGLDAYIKRRTEIDDNFNKRMAQRAKMAEESAKHEAEMKQPGAKEK
jgi:subtilisin family serine protease